LSRAADLVNTGITEMTGATAPRLHLELICARILLPGASGESGYAARLDRIERRLDVAGTPSAAAGGASPAPGVGAPLPAGMPPAPPGQRRTRRRSGARRRCHGRRRRPGPAARRPGRRGDRDRCPRRSGRGRQSAPGCAARCRWPGCRSTPSSRGWSRSEAASPPHCAVAARARPIWRGSGSFAQGCSSPAG
jgi:DNA polymerase-3 subunit gamma/tau